MDTAFLGEKESYFVSACLTSPCDQQVKAKKADMTLNLQRTVAADRISEQHSLIG
jgi:hypothetical protein